MASVVEHAAKMSEDGPVQTVTPLLHANCGRMKFLYLVAQVTAIHSGRTGPRGLQGSL